MYSTLFISIGKENNRYSVTYRFGDGSHGHELFQTQEDALNTLGKYALNIVKCLKLEDIPYSYQVKLTLKEYQNSHELFADYIARCHVCYSDDLSFQLIRDFLYEYFHFSATVEGRK